MAIGFGNGRELSKNREWQTADIESRHRSDPKWWEGCLIRIADGDSIFDLCRDVVGYRKSVFRDWIRADPARETAYLEAIDNRKEGWIEQLQSRAARAAFANVQDALTGSGDALEIAQWPAGLVSACDTAEFGPTGQIYKVKMDTGRAAERLSRYLGLDKAGEVNVNVYSLVGILSGLPKAGVESLPAPKDVEDAVIVSSDPIKATAEVPVYI